MPKGPQGQKPPVPPKSKKLPRKLPDDPVSRAVAIMREATGQDGDIQSAVKPQRRAAKGICGRPQECKKELEEILNA